MPSARGRAAIRATRAGNNVERCAPSGPRRRPKCLRWTEWRGVYTAQGGYPVRAASASIPTLSWRWWRRQPMVVSFDLEWGGKHGEAAASASPPRLRHLREGVEFEFARLFYDGDVESARNELNESVRDLIVWERNTIWRDMLLDERRKRGTHAKKTGERDRPFATFRPVPFVVALALFLAILWAPRRLFGFLQRHHVGGAARHAPNADDGGAAQRCLALMVAATMLWATEAVPLYVTSLAIPLASVAAGVFLDKKGAQVLPPAEAARTAIAAMSSPVVLLILAGGGGAKPHAPTPGGADAVDVAGAGVVDAGVQRGRAGVAGGSDPAGAASVAAGHTLHQVRAAGCGGGVQHRRHDLADRLTAERHRVGRAAQFAEHLVQRMAQCGAPVECAVGAGVACVSAGALWARRHGGAAGLPDASTAAWQGHQIQPRGGVAHGGGDGGAVDQQERFRAPGRRRHRSSGAGAGVYGHRLIEQGGLQCAAVQRHLPGVGRYRARGGSAQQPAAGGDRRHHRGGRRRRRLVAHLHHLCRLHIAHRLRDEPHRHQHYRQPDPGRAGHLARTSAPAGHGRRAGLLRRNGPAGVQFPQYGRGEHRERARPAVRGCARVYALRPPADGAGRRCHRFRRLFGHVMAGHVEEA
eukprot:ctg_110.g59